MPPDDLVGWTINSGGRGTLDLLWSCIVTICLCTYTIQRLQIVPWSRSKTMMFRKKGFWMVFTLLCPEYLTWIAVDQWRRARKYKELCKLGYADWTMQHGFYVDMGGFKIKLEGESRRLEGYEKNDEIWESNNDLWITIRLDDLIVLLKADIIPLPNIQLHDLEERSKSDAFARFITTFQVLYFVVHTIGRVGSNLPISHLEISTLAFVCCAALVEGFWWHKPLDLRSSTVAILNPEKHTDFLAILPQLTFNTPEQDLAEKKDLKLWFDRLVDGDEMKRQAIHVLWIGCIFNGIHIIAWNFTFASWPEKLLWRIASTGACVAVLMMYFAAWIRPKNIGITLSGCSAGFYCACRLYLMTEVFVGLRSVPWELYVSPDWQNMLPGV